MNKKTIFTWSLWSLFAVFCLIVFTAVKLPRDKIKTYINGSIVAALSERDFSFSAAETSLSYFMGITYELKDVTFNSVSPPSKIQVQNVRISPSILGLLLGKIKGTVEIKDPSGNLDISFSNKNTQLSVSFETSGLDIGKLGILPIVAGIQGGGIIEGKGSFSTDTSNMAKAEGSANLFLKKFVMDPQTLYGFSLPKISISETELNLLADAGKLNLKTVRIGKAKSEPKAEDDIQGTVTGALSLGKAWDQSTLDVKTKFGFSQTILKSFVLLDALLGAGKQPDGTFAFSLTGPLLSPVPMPLTAGN